MIYTVTINPCLDVLRFLDEDRRDLVDGTYRPKNPNQDEMVRPGGKGIDVSRALVCLRTETKALGFIGDHTGNIVKGLLAAEGIDHDFIDSGVETRTNVILLLREADKQGSKRCHVVAEIRVNSQGKEIPPNRYQLLYDQAGKIDDAEGVAISGSLNFNMRPRFYNSLITTFKRKNPHCTVVLDGPALATGEAMFLPLKHRPDFIKPNLKEFNELLIHLNSGEPLWHAEPALPRGIGEEEYAEYAYTALSMKWEGLLAEQLIVDRAKFRANWQKLLGHVLRIWDNYRVATLLSLGPLGCVTTDGDGNVLHAYVRDRLDAKTRVGAGDCMVAGFLSKYVERSRNVKEALKAGVAAAVARIKVDEFQNYHYLDLREYEAYLRNVEVDTYVLPGSFEPQFPDKVSSDLCRFCPGAVSTKEQLPPDDRPIADGSVHSTNKDLDSDSLRPEAPRRRASRANRKAD